MNKPTKPSPFLLLIGGLAMRREELFPLKEALAQRGFRSDCFDNLFVGKGPRPEGVQDASIDRQAAHMWQTVNREVKDSHEPIAIFGISMGGMIAATMAALHPERVAQVFLGATSPNLPTNPAVPEALYTDWANAKTYEAFKRASDIAFGKTALQKRPSLVQDYFEYRWAGKNEQKPKEFFYQLNAAKTFRGEAIYAALAKTEVKITAIAGEEDALFPKTHFADIIRLLPSASSVVLPETGHMLHLENLEGLASVLVDKIQAGIDVGAKNE